MLRDGFKEFQDPKLGTCFTFNHVEDDPAFKTNRAGPLYGKTRPCVPINRIIKSRVYKSMDLIYVTER